MTNGGLAFRLGRAWRSKGTLLVAFALVGGVGIGVGRWSRHVPEVEAKTSSPALSSAAASSAASPAVQHFDLAEDPSFQAGVPLRPMDKDIFAALADARLERTRLLDLFPDRPYKARIVGSVAERRFGGVLVDMDRDGKWDERWTLKGNEVIRLVPDDPTGGGTEIKYSLAHGRWQVH